MSYDVFISYARADNENGAISRFVQALELSYKVLTGRKLQYFFDLQEIQSGQDWERRLLESLRQSRSMIALLSRDYLKSEYCLLEWSRFDLHSAVRLVVDQGIRPLVVVKNDEFEDELKRASLEVQRLFKPIQRGVLPLNEFIDSLTDDYITQRLSELKGEKSEIDPFHGHLENPLGKELVTSIRWIELLSKRQELSKNSLSHGSFKLMNPRFVGRVAELRELRKGLAECTEVAVSAEGLAGIGKSELAIAYAHAFAWDYPAGRWFISSEGQTNLSELLAQSMAKGLGIELTPEERGEPDSGFYRIRNYLQSIPAEKRKVLVILDNVNQAELVSSVAIRGLNVDADYFDVLVTSRHRLRSGKTDEYLRTVTLGRLSDEELLDLLGVGSSASGEERDAALQLIEVTGGLTLAIEIASVFCRKKDVRMSEYVEDITEGALALLADTLEEKFVPQAIAHPEKFVEQIFRESIQNLSPTQQAILCYAACCHPDFVPLGWLERLACNEFPELGVRRLGISQFQRDLDAILDLSLLEKPALESSGFRIHRLIVETVKKMSFWTEDRPQCLVKLIKDLVESDANQKVSLPELRAVIAWHGVHKPDSESMVQLLWETAELCRDRGLIMDGLVLLQSLREEQERTLGPEHPDTLTTLNNLGILLTNKGDFAGAEALYNRVIEAMERTLGPEHPNTLSTLNNLGILLRNKGDFAGAEALYNRVIEAMERTLGPEHPNTLSTLHSVASLLDDKGDFAGAEALYNRVIEAMERTLGPEHPNTLSTLNNLGILLKAKGDLAAAEALYNRVLEARERTLGPEHPNTLSTLHSVAALLKNKGDFAGAEALCNRVIEAMERTLGPEHPNTLSTLNNLGILLTNKGDFAGAEALYNRVIEAMERTLGPEHPNTLSTLHNLASLLDDKGDFAGAEALCNRVIEAMERTLGPSILTR